MKKLLLTISLLISNRLDTIPQCLDSLKPIMEAIPCELILIDTSKNSEVHNLLLEYTDQVYEFEWCNDFAKARNEGMKRASGEWFLYLDDDEWFVETDEMIDFFQSGEYKKYAYANYIQRNFVDEDYIRYEDCWVSRVVRLDKNVKFVSKIHEYFTPVNNLRKDLHVIVHHCGYVFDTPEKRDAHFKRNYLLLKEMIGQEPNHLRWHLHLTQEYVSVQKWDELITFCEECLKLLDKENRPDINDNIGTFYEGIARGHYEQKRYRESIEICQRALSDRRANEILIAIMYLRLAENYFRLDEYDKVVQHIQGYLNLAKTVNRESVAFRNQTSAKLIQNPFEETNLRIAYNMLVCSYLEQGEIELMADSYDKLGWNQEVIYSIDHVEKYMIKALWNNEYYPIFLSVIIDVLGNKKLNQLFRNEILSQEMDSANEFQRTLFGLEMALQTLIDGPQEGDMIRYYKAFGEYVNALCDWNDFMEQQGEAETQSERMVGYFQAAISINAYLEMEKQNVVEALRCLKEAAEALPEIAEGVGRFVNSYEELDKQRAELQKKEMDMLRVQVISQAKTMLEMGQVQAAKQIIEQLSMMFPGDVEINELTKVLQKKLME